MLRHRSLDLDPEEMDREATMVGTQRGLDLEVLGAVAQLGERGLCKPEVVGSIPISSTRFPSIDAIRRGRESPSGSR